MSVKSQVFFQTKRKIVAAIDHRTDELRSQIDKLTERFIKTEDEEEAALASMTIFQKNEIILEFENLRNYIRNGMLWDTRPGRKRKK